MGKICNNCNSPIEKGAVFCTQCGSSDIREGSIKNKKENKAIYIILAAIGIILLSVGIIILVYNNENNKIDFTNSSEGHTSEIEDFSEYFTKENSIRVGTKDYGYISIPKTWVKFVDPNSPSVLQYTDNGSWIVTLYSVPTTSKTAEEWASVVYNSISQDGAINIDSHKTKINNHNAIEVNGYYKEDNIYLSTWFFEDNNGITHYIALEGPENTGDNFNIVFSFKEDK